MGTLPPVRWSPNNMMPLKPPMCQESTSVSRAQRVLCPGKNLTGSFRNPFAFREGGGAFQLFDFRSLTTRWAKIESHGFEDAAVGFIPNRFTICNIFKTTCPQTSEMPLSDRDERPIPSGRGCKTLLSSLIFSRLRSGGHTQSVMGV